MAAAPYGFRGQNQTATQYSNVLQFPNNLVTSLGGINALAESGNANILINPNFEHATVATGWSSTTVTPAAETTVVFSGKKSLSMTATAQAWTLTQSSTLYEAQLADSAQGLAYVRIKSSHTGAVTACSIQAGIVSTTNCLTVIANSKWNLYKLPFTMGGTSNGISISAASGTGVTYIDDAFVGSQDLKQDINIVTAWQTFTPTSTWVSNATHVGRWRQVGDSAEYEIAITTTGAPTSATLAVNLLPGHVIDTAKLSSVDTTASSLIPGGIATVKDFGISNYNSSQVNYNNTTSVIPTADTGAGTAVQITQASPITFANGDIVRLSFKVPIVGFSGATSIYSAPSLSVDTYSAQVSATGVVTGENVDWINGNCSVATSTFTCTYNTNLNNGAALTSAMNCVANASPNNINGQILTSSTTNVQPQTFVSSSGGMAANPFSLVCQKAGSDFNATRTIVGQFTNQNPVAIIRDQKSSGTVAQTITSGSYVQRTLNTLEDPYSIVTSLSSNQFVLPAGRYLVEATAPTYATSYNKIKLANITDSTDQIIGAGAYNPGDVLTFATMSGIFTITSAKTFDIKHRVNVTNSGGLPTTYGDVEIYTQVKITRLTP